MLTRTKFSLCVIALFAADFCIAADHIPDWVHEELLAPWYAAFNSQDANAIADLYTRTAKVGNAEGRDAIIAQFNSIWAEYNLTCTGTYDGFQIVGDVATGWGRDSCTQSPKSGGETTTVNSRWLAVYERQDDGTWLCSRDISEEYSD